MTVSSAANKVIYAGNGIQTAFTFNFVGVAAADIQVYFTDASGNQSLLSPSQYGLTLNAAAAGQLWGVGGTVTYPVSGSPLAVGQSLTILRALPLAQTTSLQNQGAFYATAVEQALDTVTMLVQQVNEIFNRALQAAASDQVPTPLPTAAQRASKFLGFDSTGNPTVFSGISGGTVISSVMIPVVTAGTLALAQTAMGFGSIATNIWAGAAATPGLVFNDGVGGTGLYSSAAGNVDVVVNAAQRVANFNSLGTTAFNNLRLQGLGLGQTIQQSQLFGFRARVGVTDNAVAAGGGYTIDNNTAAAGDFSTSTPVEYTLQNYATAFNSGFFWNPSNIPLGDDTTYVRYAENFTIGCKHTLSQDRPTAHVSTTSGVSPNISVTGIVVDAQPPYPYAPNQVGIQVVLFGTVAGGGAYGGKLTIWGKADGSGNLLPAASWSANQDGTGTALPTAGVFTGTPTILIQPPNPPGSSPWTVGFDGGPAVAIARILGSNFISKPSPTSGTVVGPMSFSISDAGASGGVLLFQMYGIHCNASNPTGNMVIGTQDVRGGALLDRLRIGRGIALTGGAGTVQLADKGTATVHATSYWVGDVGNVNGYGGLQVGSSAIQLFSTSNIYLNSGGIAAGQTIGFTCIPGMTSGADPGTPSPNPNTNGLYPIVVRTDIGSFGGILIWHSGAWHRIALTS